MTRFIALGVISLVGISAVHGSQAQRPDGVFVPAIPRAWDDSMLASLEVPLPHSEFSPKAVSADYYYRIPVRPIFRGYPVYAPGREPAGYLDWLKQREPQLLWNDGKTKPPLQTESDWITAGAMVFDAAIFYDAVASANDVRNSDWYTRVAPITTSDGILPYATYVVREKGKVELGNNACGFCHTRVLPDGTVVKGAQGNFPFDRAVGVSTRRVSTETARAAFRALFGAPWLKDGDPAARAESISIDELAAKYEAIPPGVVARHRASADSPPAVPDLIGIKERRYLDKTGLIVHRDIGDLMRYAALNNELDFLSSFGDFIPAGRNFRELPEPTDPNFVGGGRYSDEQLYALALYLYSLRPPPNPNRRTAQTARGGQIFEKSGCGTCHTPPLYTNNRLTPALDFVVPTTHRMRFDITPIVVGTDPTLTLRTRRGTGYYKVPSLKGVWYRGPFEHNGSAATLEDWFDPRRLRDDYVPTGFSPVGVKMRAVKGHQFGLNLSAEERRDLVAFLKTL